ncbi:MAG: hypothetical protein ABSG91_24340 [Syntrophobacteraceae bacterium]
MLAQYVNEYWLDNFIKYFKIDASERKVEESAIVDSEYIEDNYYDLVDQSRKLKSTLNGSEWNIIWELFLLCLESSSGLGYSGVAMADLLMELGRSEDYYRDEFIYFRDLGYLDGDTEDGKTYLYLTGHANSLVELHEKVTEEIEEAGEDESDAIDIIEELIS